MWSAMASRIRAIIKLTALGFWHFSIPCIGIYLLPWARVADRVSGIIVSISRDRWRHLSWHIAAGVMLLIIAGHGIVAYVALKVFDELYVAPAGACVCAASTQHPRRQDAIHVVLELGQSGFGNFLVGVRSLSFAALAFIFALKELATFAWAFPRFTLSVLLVVSVLTS